MSVLCTLSGDIIDINCYSPVNDGKTYKGNMNKTHGGYDCQHWNSVDNTTYEDTHNFCRNPGPPGGVGPWCYYTSNQGVKWETCDVKICNNSRAIEYLVKYGYLAKNQSASYCMRDGRPDRHTREALLDFQSFFGINKTGVFDKETLKVMAAPRCGLKDRVEDGSEDDYYVLHGSKWLKTNLTYKVKKYPSKITRTDVDNTIMAAMRIWEAVTNIRFEKRHAGEVDIDISFEKGDHGCGIKFDGPFDGEANNRLGHAFYPYGRLFSGDIHMDDTENWIIGSRIFKISPGINLLSVFTHELGHSLGLRHSAATDSMMTPKFNWYEPKLKLHEDDIKAIRSLYGYRKMESCASELSFSWFSVSCKIKRDDCAPRIAKNLKFNFLKLKCGCRCCDRNGCGTINYGN